MQVTIDVGSLLSNGDEVRLRLLFRAETDVQFRAAVRGLAKAATREYFYMILHGGMPGRLDEVRQLRLKLLIDDLFDGSIPTETDVGDLFQQTPTQSRSLVRNTLVR